MWLTTTPRGVVHWLYKYFVLLDLEDKVLDALESAGYPRDPSKLLSWHRASTWENKDNLNPIFFAILLATYQGKWREQELEGRFVSFEGLVYDNYEPDVHLIDPIKLADAWPRWRVVDFGYKNPFCCQWWCRDPDGRYYRYREMYMTRRTVNQHALDILDLTGKEHIVDTICDHDAEDRATLEEHGIETIPAIRQIRAGIQDVWHALELDAIGKSDVYLFRNALVERDPLLVAEGLPTCTEEEFPLYAWPRDREGRPRKEIPIDLHNHGMDCLRMLISTLEGSGEGVIEVGDNFLSGYRG
jgi:phage terminase large subunit